MSHAVGRLAELGGGIVLVEDGSGVAELPLPVAGLLSDRPLGGVVRASEMLDAGRSSSALQSAAGFARDSHQRTALADALGGFARPFLRGIYRDHGSRRSFVPRSTTKDPDLQELYGSDGTRTRDLRRDRPNQGPRRSGTIHNESPHSQGFFGRGLPGPPHSCVNCLPDVWATNGPRNVATLAHRNVRGEPGC
jgi:hypothetical protein